jgi:hypothetical protein
MIARTLDFSKMTPRVGSAQTGVSVNDIVALQEIINIQDQQLKISKGERERDL